MMDSCKKPSIRGTSLPISQKRTCTLQILSKTMENNMLTIEQRRFGSEIGTPQGTPTALQPLCLCHRFTDKHDRYCNVPLRNTVKTSHNLPLQRNRLHNTLTTTPTQLRSWRTRQTSPPRVRNLETMLHHEQRQAINGNTDDTQSPMKTHPTGHRQHMSCSLTKYESISKDKT